MVDTRPVSILVVEDDPALRTLFLALLERQGFEVESVTDGSQALDRLERKSYTVLLLDLMMPVVNGFDVLKHFSESQPWLLRQTIVTTGVSQRELAKIDSGSVFAVLRKPFDIDSLVATVRECAREAARRRPRRATPFDSGDDGDGRLSGSLRKLESALPELRQLLATSTTSDHELLLRNELRRVVGELAGVLSTAASCAGDAERAKHYERLGRSAWSLAGGIAPRSKQRDH
jgi:CheY-like chemotaxis protein